MFRNRTRKTVVKNLPRLEKCRTRWTRSLTSCFDLTSANLFRPWYCKVRFRLLNFFFFFYFYNHLFRNLISSVCTGKNKYYRSFFPFVFLSNVFNLFFKLETICGKWGERKKRKMKNRLSAFSFFYLSKPHFSPF